MKKRMMSIMLTFVMLCAFVPRAAMAAESGTCGADAAWTLDDNGTLTISGTGEIPYDSHCEWEDYKNNIKKIVVEEGITKISGFCFADSTSLVTVELPDSLTNIELPFEGCTALTEIKVGEGNTEYSSENGILFDKNKQMILQYPSGKTDSSFTVPDYVTGIDNSSFDGAVYLEKVVIPESVASISSTFSWCSKLKEIVVEDGNNYYCSVDGVLFDKEKNQIITYPSKKTQTSYAIPDTVTEIGFAAFCGSSLETIDIPDTIKTVSNSAFISCASLVNISLPEGLEKLGLGAFSRCSSLKSMTIPKGITTVGNSLFEGCESLESVDLPEGITEIGWEAFAGCTSLENIDLPESVTRIDDEAFCECIALKRIEIPSAVHSINREAFRGCAALESVSLSNGIKTIGEGAFYACTALKSVRVPGSVNLIDQYAFSGCKSLESVSISEGVTTIGCNAFEKCESIKSVHIPNSIKHIYEYAFNNCYDLEDVYYNGTEAEWGYLCNYGNIDQIGNNALAHYAEIHYEPKPLINGTPTVSLNGNTYTATVPLKNVLIDSQLIAVLYKDGLMKDIETKAIPLNAESESISVSSEDADEIKIFIWDSLSGARPMCGGYSERLAEE